MSEPLMTCRKRRDDVETRGESLTWDKSGGEPAYCPGGIRHEGGATCVRLPWGTWDPVAPMIREKSKWRTHEDESTDAGHRRGAAHSSDEGS